MKKPECIMSSTRMDEQWGFGGRKPRIKENAGKHHALPAFLEMRLHIKRA
jgi:hypothetical protein